MKSRVSTVCGAIALTVLVLIVSRATTPGTSLNFQLVGHEPLFNRGMNAAPAIFDHFVYIGSRPVWLQTPAAPDAVPQNCTKNAAAGGVGCPNSHSAVKVPGRLFALTTDEVYGTYTDPSFGCPWGWARLISILDPSQPKIVGEFKIAEDQLAFCGSAADDPLTEQFTSFSSHNPTVLPDLAIIAWHSGGMQVADISNPTNPVQAGFFAPVPLDAVATEDSALSRGPNKDVMWSYPIIKNGLIYVVDVRNGLYILKYTGPFAAEVAQIGFFEGNSNLGDAVRLDP